MPVIQVALLDIVGATRGPEDPTLKQFQSTWPKVEVRQFSLRARSRDWLSQWPITVNGPVCKIFYNQSEGKLRLIAIVNEQKNETSFELNAVSELPQLIEKSKAQLDEWLK